MNPEPTRQQIEIIRQGTAPLEPIPTAQTTRLESLESIHGVVFDVYGTLIISGVGDISIAGDQDRDEPLRNALEAAGFSFNGDGEGLAQRFYDAIHQAQREEIDKQDNLKFPEVEIRDVWQSFIKTLLGEALIEGELTLARVAETAVRYEIAVNPVHPMPGCESLLADLRSRSLPIGIISNAQFFTPLLFEAFFGKSLDELGVDLRVSIWSYLLREAKPSRILYRKAADEWWEHHRIKPHNLLYVGNDVRNDIWPAAACKFRTALFAGDKRSLRLRQDDPDCASVKPDLVLTGLSQVLDCIS